MSLRMWAKIYAWPLRQRHHYVIGVRDENSSHGSPIHPIAADRAGGGVMPTFTAAFDLGERVIVDESPDLVAVVTGVQFRSAAPAIEISYFDRGKHETVWIEPWRLTALSETARPSSKAGETR